MNNLVCFWNFRWYTPAFTRLDRANKGYVSHARVGALYLLSNLSITFHVWKCLKEAYWISSFWYRSNERACDFDALMNENAIFAILLDRWTALISTSLSHAAHGRIRHRRWGWGFWDYACLRLDMCSDSTGGQNLTGFANTVFRWTLALLVVSPWSLLIQAPKIALYCVSSRAKTIHSSEWTYDEMCWHLSGKFNTSVP